MSFIFELKVTKYKINRKLVLKNNKNIFLKLKRQLRTKVNVVLLV